MPTGFRSRIAAVVALLLGAVTLAYGGALGFLKLNEADLVFRAQDSQRWATGFAAPPAPSVREVRIPVHGSLALHGFTVAADPARDMGFWILHLHGNADSAYSSGQLASVMQLAAQGFSVLAFDYRGFGPTPGEPSEEGLYEDAEAAWQWLLAQGVPAERLIVWGHSLGSGPATRLAATHRAAGLVLFGAFTSVPDRAAEMYPWLPVRWVAGIQFNSIQRIALARTPVVIAHSAADITIPYAHGERLFAAAPEPKRLLRLDPVRGDGFGGHVTALYDQLPLLMPLLRDMQVIPGD